MSQPRHPAARASCSSALGLLLAAAVLAAACAPRQAASGLDPWNPADPQGAGSVRGPILVEPQIRIPF